ncbi:hypothetical protein FHR72_003503 [Mycolicibacterium iranicum]|uniref:Glycoside hydrolase family 5 domain-containing protein n=1 Tax=Mycolicibacterium iranicum TaxID=912594 RepID=A0A839Q8N8_MYCIR|nr:cellulase family glycosylhydrolase [Mycolicibacterium iranicum]MBB2992007.1 hypothetical protein [Mycolicibacterium iranicum]
MTHRRRRATHLLLVILCGLTALSCGTAEPRPEIGMTVHSRGADGAAINRQFDVMAEMNVTWVRVDIDWSVVENQRGQFDWTYPDAVVDAASARGMNVLAVVAFTPAWARPGTPGDDDAARHSRPAQLSEWAEFNRTVAERYAPRGVHSYEIWNEQNSSKFWPPRPDVNEYGTLFWVAADAIRAVDPHAAVLTGGLSPKFDDTDAEIAPADYLDRLYANGAAKHADGIAIHPYTFPALPMESPQRMVGGFKDLPELHAVMERHGDADKKLWITEFGAPTGTEAQAVSEDAQAAALIQARDQVKEWDWAGPLIYYELVDGGNDPADKEQNFGVLREDLSPKPAADALKDAAAD